MLGQPFSLDRVSQVGCVAPELREVSAWINSEPLTLSQLRGKVVVVHFWAFGCINCIRNLPHYQGWYEKFDPAGLTIIGLQTPETEAERSLENLKRQVTERKIAYPVAFDSASENWKAWGNDMWPSVYLIDKKGPSPQLVVRRAELERGHRRGIHAKANRRTDGGRREIGRLPRLDLNRDAVILQANALAQLNLRVVCHCIGVFGDAVSSHF